MALSFLRSGQMVLDERFPLPLDEPFTRSSALRAGIQSSELSALVRLGLVRRPIAGVFVVAQAADSLELRIACLRLVVPPDAVVTDRTAGWLHGAPMILAPGDHERVPALSVFDRKRGGRYRNELTRSGQRMMRTADLMDVDGLLVTTPLRTACDLGRLLKRDQAFAALDAMLRLGRFTKDELVDAAAGYRGYRWVRQLRALAPWADARAESPQESILRLRWLDCPGLPPPEPQRPVPAPVSALESWYFLDVGNDDLRFAVEYDGEDFHGEPQREHDEVRRTWITDEHGWVIRVVRKHNIQGPGRDIERILRDGVAEARDRSWPR